MDPMDPMVWKDEGETNAIQTILNFSEVDEFLLLESLTLIRKSLSSPELGNKIHNFIAAGIVPYVIHLLRHENSEIQFQAAWVLCNITSGTVDETKVVVHSGAIPLFLDFISNGKASRDLVEQSIWVLGNIAGNTPEDRDAILQADPAILEKLERLVPTARVGMCRNICWTLSNLTGQGVNVPLPEPLLTNAIRVLINLLPLNDLEVQQDACCGLACPAQNPDNIGKVLQAGVLPHLNQILHQNGPSTDSIRLLANLASGTQEQIQTILDSGVIRQICRSLSSGTYSFMTPYCPDLLLLLSNVLNHATLEQLEKVLLSQEEGSSARVDGLLHFLLVILRLPGGSVNGAFVNPRDQFLFHESLSRTLGILQKIFEKARILPFPHGFAMSISRSDIPVFESLEQLSGLSELGIDKSSLIVKELMEEAMEEISLVKPAKKS